MVSSPPFSPGRVVQFSALAPTLSIQHDFLMWLLSHRPCSTSCSVVYEIPFHTLTLLSGQSFPSPRSFDLQIAVCQLAVEVLTKLPKRIRKRQAVKASKLAKLARSKVHGSDAEATEGLWEVIGGIEEMNI